MELTLSTSESYFPSNTLQQKGSIMSAPSYPNNLEQQSSMYQQDNSGSTTNIINPQDTLNVGEVNNNETLSSGINTSQHNESTYIPRQIFPTTQNITIPRMRRQMIASIITYLRQQPTNYPLEENHQIRNVAHRFEHALYTQASTLEEYRDLTTLPRRLQALLQRMPRQNMVIKRAPLRETTTTQNDSEVEEIRRRMTVDILNHLQQRALHASEACHRRLPTIARMFEEALWKMSTNIDEYRDLRTLKTRLQSLAIANGAQAPRSTG